MTTDGRWKATVLGFLVCGSPIAVIAIWVGMTESATTTPDYETPSQPLANWTPSPARTTPIGDLEPAVHACGDGTEGTFAECWQRLGSSYPTPTPWERVE